MGLFFLMGILQDYLAKLKEKRFREKLEKEVEKINEDKIENYNAEVRRAKVKNELEKEKRRFLLFD